MLRSVITDSNNQPLWIHNDMTGYQLWASGQPSNTGGNEACVNIWPNRGYLWNDAPCSRLYCFVCENRNINV